MSVIRRGTKIKVGNRAFITLYPCIKSDSKEVKPWFYTAVVDKKRIRWIRIRSETTTFATEEFLRSIDAPCGLASDLSRGQEIGDDDETMVIIRSGIPLKTIDTINWDLITFFNLTFAQTTDKTLYILVHDIEGNFKDVSSSSILLSEVLKRHPGVFV